jgi:hypothetical protein
LNTLDTTGAAPFGTKFVGKFDMQDIGLMGHSRGGEGVVQAYLQNEDRGSPYGIKAVFALAPVDFFRNKPNNVPFAVLLPYTDGDVSDLQGMHFFDDMGYNVAGDTSPKYEILVMGTDHNYFNTVWTPGLYPTIGAPYGAGGTADDWSGNPGAATLSARATDPYAGVTSTSQRLTPQQAQAVNTAYEAAFFREYLRGETQFQPILTGDAPVPASASPAVVYTSYSTPDTKADRLVVNSTLDPNYLTVNSLGGAVTETGLSTYTMAGGAAPEPRLVLANEPAARQPDSGPSARDPLQTPGKSQLVLSWDDPTATYTNFIPSTYSDVSAYSTFQFRAGLNFDDYRNSFSTQDFSVALTDGHGHTVETPISPYTNWLFYPPGKVSPLPKLILQGIRIPLTAFAGVDLTDVTSVQFAFDRRPMGYLVFSDLAFVDRATSTVSTSDITA